MTPTVSKAKSIFQTQTFRWLVIGLTAGALLASVFWTLSANNRVVTPTDASADAGFARDMGDHHQQAVDMAFIIRDKSADQPIRTLAFDIINTQATQRGMVMGWLQQWGLPQTTSRPALAWINGGAGHESMSSMEMSGGRMPGMASPEEIEKLKSLTGKEADILFMQLMIRHHTGGISMAKGLLERSEREEVRGLAQTIVNGQQAEIELLTQMLEERGANP